MRRLLILVTILTVIYSVSASLQAQTIISGGVRDESQKALPNINILVYAHGSNALIAFGISNQQGLFRIEVNTTVDSLCLEATSVHYRNEKHCITNATQNFIFDLVPETKNLDEFVVRASPIEQRGDTISYLVSTFAREQDRSIADVLHKMPGIEVEPSGRILYQGEPIQHFYVEGLDLMAGRYGLVSNNMPHRSVATVQILENHQPIKILEERLPSHRASLNITLKKEVTTTGTARLGSGLTPLLWDANVTPMMFTRNLQLAGSYQANNAGQDVAKQLDTFTIEGLRERFENNTHRPQLLSVIPLSPPDFNVNRHLDNNIHLLNANMLQRLSGDLQLRTNIHFIHDLQQQQGNTRRTLYMPADTLVFNEQINNKLRKSSLRGEITLTRNTKNNYLNNKFEFQSHLDKQTGKNHDNQAVLTQQLSHPFHTFSNRLSMVKPLGGKLVQINSFFHYDHSPLQLSVSPGRFELLLNDTFPFDQVRQDITLQRFNANHAASLGHTLGRLHITSRLGFQYQQQQLSSEILLSAEDQIWQAEGPFANNQLGLRTRTYLQTEWAYRRRDALSFTADIPISHVFINLYDKHLPGRQQINRFIAEPRFSADYRMSNFWRIRGSYGYNEIIGDMESIHYAYLLKDYRSLQLNDAPLPQSQRHSLSAFLSHRNPITSFFSSLSYVYSISSNNLLYASRILADGSSIMQATEKENTSYMHNASARTSKYFSKIKSTLSLQCAFTHNQRLWQLNDATFKGYNNAVAITPKVNVKFNDHISGEARTEWMYYNTFRGSEKLSEVNAWKHVANLLVFPTQNQYVSLSGEYYAQGDRHDYFFDLAYRYTITAYRIDIDTKWVNILNHKTYKDFYLGGYYLVENEYTLRPTQLLVSVRFSF